MAAGYGPPTYNSAWAIGGAQNASDSRGDIDGEHIEIELSAGDCSQDLSDPESPPAYDTVQCTVSSASTLVQHPREPEESYADLINLNEEEAREVLLDHVSGDCRYGKRPAREMNINNIIPSSAFHYELVTFAESRQTRRKFDIYLGGEVDGPSNGTPPRTWDIITQPQMMFCSERQYIDVPHTSKVKTCHKCFGLGTVTCSLCYSSRKINCFSCEGKGFKTADTDDRLTTICTTCHGEGRIWCGNCSGMGRTTCHVCKGHKLVKWSVELAVTFTNLASDRVVKHTDLPKRLIKDARGTTILQETEDLVRPIVSHAVPELSSESMCLVTAHIHECQRERKRIIKQKHSVKAVPVSEVHWTWQTKGSRFWVYGERSLYVKNYPRSNYWGCHIL